MIVQKNRQVHRRNESHCAFPLPKQELHQEMPNACTSCLKPLPIDTMILCEDCLHAAVGPFVHWPPMDQISLSPLPMTLSPVAADPLFAGRKTAPSSPLTLDPRSLATLMSFPGTDPSINSCDGSISIFSSTSSSSGWDASSEWSSSFSRSLGDSSLQHFSSDMELDMVDALTQVGSFVHLQTIGKDFVIAKADVEVRFDLYRATLTCPRCCRRFHRADALRNHMRRAVELYNGKCRSKPGRVENSKDSATQGQRKRKARHVDSDLSAN